MGSFDKLGIMIDCSRNAVMTVDAVKRMIDLSSGMGYNFIMLYTEDTYEMKNQPYFGYFRGRYTTEEIKAIDAYAAEKGMELIPCIQTLAHLGSIMRWEPYSRICDCNDILCAGEPEVYKLIEDMFIFMSESFTSRTVNIGMDEAHFIGLGKYMQKHGIKNRLNILLEHLDRVSQIAQKYGFNLLMWGDMFFRLANNGNYDGKSDASVKDRIPKNVTLVYWDYYSYDKKHYDEQIEHHQAVSEDVWFAGGLWTWTGFAPHNEESVKMTKPAVESCIEHGVRNVIMTMWGDDGGECSRFAALPSMYAASEFFKGNYDMDSIKRGFEEKFGVSYDLFSALDLPGTPNCVPFKRNNPDKYMLYNDCFTGVMDSTVGETDAQSFKKCAELLEKGCALPQFGVLFRAEKALCDVLALKTDIGIRTRKAYRENDSNAITTLIADYDEMIKRIEMFYNAYEKQWSSENKPFGFDVQDIRLGGLIMRVKHCRARLAEYLNGNTDCIPELEEDVLPFCSPDAKREPLEKNSWGLTATSNVLIF